MQNFIPRTFLRCDNSFYQPESILHLKTIEMNLAPIYENMLSSIPYVCMVCGIGIVASFGTDFILTRGPLNSLLGKGNALIALE